MQKQLKKDPEYADYLTAQDLVQLYGRINRAADDFGETWIVDDQIEWFIERHKDFFPEYFLNAFQPVTCVMDPPSMESLV